MVTVLVGGQVATYLVPGRRLQAAGVPGRTLLAGAALVSTDQARLATAMAVGAAVGSVLQFAVQLPSVVRLTRGLRLSTSFASTAAA